tara:strand:- start:463 stop:1278 length:816 start_codon:yes stop_codon:yes gene_type:complete
MSIHAIVLAAGKGTRMRSDMAKVLHCIAGRPMILWCLDAISSVDDVVVVIGHQAKAVAEVLPDHVRTVVQRPQLGTGHAAEVGLGVIELLENDHVIVTSGDMPLVTKVTIDGLLSAHIDADATATILTAIVDDPSGYGRILRNKEGDVEAIVEDRDATPDQRKIAEINTSVYVFRADKIASALSKVHVDNSQGERYLTDVIALYARSGAKIVAMPSDASDAIGVNSAAELQAADATLRSRISSVADTECFGSGRVSGYAARQQGRDNREPQ